MSLARPRVLVADDHAVVAKAVGRLLAPDCEIVGTVADGSALLESMQRLEPDVVVLDVNLAGIHGLEACRQLTEVNPAVKINKSILHSGFILLPSHAVDSRRSLTLQSVEAVAQKIDVEMVEQSGELFLSSSFCCFAHIVQPLGHASPALCQEHA